MANRIIKKKQESRSTFEETASLIMGTFTLVVLCLFPLVYHDYYFDILETKYQFYCAAAIITMIVMAGYGLVKGRLLAALKSFKPRDAASKMSFTDWAMLAFWMSNVLSWAFCKDWRWEAFWGTSGRYNGVFLVTVYMIVYFMMTRFFRFRQWYLDAFLATGILVCAFGITDYFQMDIMGFKVNMLPEQKQIYTSTLGNINTYTIYVGAVMVVATMLFVQENNKKRMLWYYGNMILAAFALIMGASDNAYLTLAALFGLSPLCLFHTKRGLRRYLISAATFFSVIQCIDWINTAYAGTVWGLDSAFQLIAGLDMLPFLVAALWLLAGAVTALTVRKTAANENDELGAWLVRIWIGVIAAVLAAVVFMFYDANVAGNAERYGAAGSYLVFNDSWGTDRGYVWKRAIELFTTKLTTLQKIFGYGADTFVLLMQYYFDGRMQNGRVVYYDSAHNEYLNYLVTIGIVGMVSYILFMGSSVVGMWKRLKGRPEVAAVMLAIAAYMVQALVNINLPVAMPVILHLLAMGLSKTGEAAG